MEGEQRDQNKIKAGSLKGNEGEKRCKVESIISSPCKSSNSPNAFGRTSDNLRSVLMHPMGLPLVVYLNGIQNHHDHPAYIKNVLDNFTNSRNDDSRLRDNVFAATALDWGGGETDFTEKLWFNINYCEIGEELLTTAREKKVVKEKETGKVDFIFHEKVLVDQSSASSVVALFEFGIGNGMWWTKQDQVLKYASMLLQTNTDNNNNYKIDQPVLLSVITINDSSKSQDANIIKWANVKCANQEEYDAFEKKKGKTFDLNIDGIVSKTSDTEKIPFEARFGVFLCIPMGEEGKFRLALLWRHETETLKDASTQFGKMLYAVQLCSFLSKNCNLNENAIQYTYLGPHCCKIGDYVRLIYIYIYRIKLTLAAQ